MEVKVKVLNRHFALIDYGHGAPRVEPNPFELAKQACLLDAARGGSLPLPHFGYWPDWRMEGSHPDLFKWMSALMHQNPPSRVSFRLNPQRFRELVEPLDFSRPFDERVVKSIQAEFTAGGAVRAEVSGEDILHGELLDDGGVKNP